MQTQIDNQESAQAYAQGICKYRQGHFDAAVEQLSKVAAQGDLCGRVARYYQGMAHRQLGMAAMSAGKFDQARKHLDAAMTAVGREADLASYLGSVYALAGKNRQCATEMEKAASREASAAAAKSLALAQWQSGRRIEGMMTLTAGIRQFPDEAQLHLLLGIFHAVEEKHGLAWQELSKACELDGACAEARYYLGMVASAEQDPESAVRHLQHALEIKPSDLLIAYQLSIAAKAALRLGHRVEVHLGDRACAGASDVRVGRLARLVASEPDFIDAVLSLPASAADDEMLSLLEAVLKMALLEHPKYADLNMRCGQVLHRLGRLDEAVNCVERALEANPRYVAALIELARLHARKNDAAKALESLERAIELGADWPDIHCLAGQLLAQSGRPADAAQHADRALRLNGNYQAAHELRRALAA